MANAVNIANQDRLKPCPFCGSKTAPSVDRTNPRAWWVTCEYEDSGCGAQAPSRRTRFAAVLVWNRRVVPK